MLATCKKRFRGTNTLTVPSVVTDLNLALQDLKFRIDLVGCDADSRRYYVFANKVVARGFHVAVFLAIKLCCAGYCI